VTIDRRSISLVWLLPIACRERMMGCRVSEKLCSDEDTYFAKCETAKLSQLCPTVCTYVMGGTEICRHQRSSTLQQCLNMPHALHPSEQCIQGWPRNDSCSASHVIYIERQTWPSRFWVVWPICRSLRADSTGSAFWHASETFKAHCCFVLPNVRAMSFHWYNLWSASTTLL
jgi:hypothetical protein